MKFRLPKLPKIHLSKKVLIVAGAFAVVVVIAIIFLVLLLNSIARQQTTNQNLSYTPIVPADKQASKIGHWEKSPSGDIYVYVDSISGTVISVSEQQLPSSFSSDTDNKMATFAKAQNATTTLAAGNVTLYLGLSAKGPQSAIFTKNNLLVLIKSASKINNDAWIAYIKSLK